MAMLLFVIIAGLAILIFFGRREGFSSCDECVKGGQFWDDEKMACYPGAGRNRTRMCGPMENSEMPQERIEEDSPPQEDPRAPTERIEEDSPPQEEYFTLYR